MKVSKLAILYYFLKLRFSRLRRSSRISSKMKKSWKKTLNKSSFYADLLQKETPFPIMDKTQFMNHFDVINTVGVKKEDAFRVALKSEEDRDFSPTINGISIGLSSGTSGNRGIFLTSKKEKAIWVGAVLDRVIGFSFRKRKVAFFLRANNNLYEAVNSHVLSFSFFDLKIPLEYQFERLKQLNADILVGQPSILLAIAKRYQAKELTPPFQTVISVAEVLEEDYEKTLSSIFNCQIKQVYQCTEGFLAYTCKAGKLHLNEDWLEIEKKYLDAEHTRFHPIITDYLRESQPIVRYELNDILHEDHSACTCGSQSTILSKIEGRSDDVFSFKVQDEIITVYPDFIRRSILKASPDILDYAVSLSAKDEIKVSLIVKHLEKYEQVFQLVQEELLGMLEAYGIENIHIVKTNYTHDPTTKFRRVRNEYSKSI